jgi:glutamine amidotransferase
MLVIIDYNAGNIRSVRRACAEVGIEAVVTSDPGVVGRADKIIFPGVGAAVSAMQFLTEKGLDTALKNAFTARVPILGICLGAQIIMERSEEGNQPCLGLIAGSTVRFQVDDRRLKIPHMGWNEVRVLQPHPVLDGIKTGDEFYFVHAYYPQPADEENIYAVSDHGGRFCVALGQDNLFATQFHPEKSGRLGLEMLTRFSHWDGAVRK